MKFNILLEKYLSLLNESLPPGISKNDIIGVDEYNKEFKDGVDLDKLEEDETAFTTPADKDSVDKALKQKFATGKKRDEINSRVRKAERMYNKIPLVVFELIDVDKDEKISDEEYDEFVNFVKGDLIDGGERIKLTTRVGKMKESGGTKYHFINTSLPSFAGWYVDAKTNELRIVRTCLRAGQCADYCYASGGQSTANQARIKRLMRMMTFYMNDYDGFKKQLILEIEYSRIEASGKQLVVRWHDSGDVISPNYLLMMMDIAKEMPDVIFYAYTKMHGIVKKTKDMPPNLKWTHSKDPDNTVEEEHLDDTDRKAMVVPTKLFKDLWAKNKKPKNDDDIETVKQRLSKEFSFPIDSIITYSEMMDKPEGSKPKWNVMVFKGHGDDAAIRDDVLNILLFEH